VHAEAIRKLQQIMGKEGVVTDETQLLVYECDALSLFKHQPEAVVFAQNAKQVSDVIKVANEYSIPFLPRGSGTGLSGGAMAAEGGIIIEMQRMNKILSIDVENRIAVVQPGVVNLHITQAASPLGMYYAPDPSSQMACSIGW
jgi:glycolate oxidase